MEVEQHLTNSGKIRKEIFNKDDIILLQDTTNSDKFYRLYVEYGQLKIEEYTE